MNDRLLNLGFTEQNLSEASFYEKLFPGRVVSQHRNLYRVATAGIDLTAEISGKIRHLASASSDLPVVGDFVMIDRNTADTGNAIIHHVLRRKSAIERKAAGTSGEVQIIAANINTIFICMALNSDFNLRRLERYLSVSWASGALPVVVLTKSDLCDDTESMLSKVGAVAAGADILITTSMAEDGYQSIKKYISVGKTVAFIGSSGVGKSTLINRLMGEDIIKTGTIRKDDKGRHITTRRELILIPSGGAVIDTPGMRELGVESADLGKAFSDIVDLAKSCRFSDCTHTVEPYCAVRKAIESGSLSEKRLTNYLKLQKEARYDGLNAREIEQEKIREMFSEIGGIKNARDYIKNKNKRPS
jgi:ribosome biogenesis GTPase / thiamine phosphate phosphatase